MGRTRYISGDYSEAGRTAKNQDCSKFFDLTLPDGGSGPRRTVKVAIAADGINGHQGGAVASETAVDVINKAFKTLDTAIPDRMQLAIQQANRAIYDQALQDPTLRGMGCTVVMAVLDAEKLYIANVGDSRSYLIRGGIAHQLTEDHVRTEGAQSSTPQLTRRLGRTSKVNVDIGCIPLGNASNNQAARVTSIELQRGDAILLCTDGLTGRLSDDYIQQIVSTTRPPQAAAQQLVAKARAAGATDDITALVVRWPDRTRRNVWLLGLLLLLGLLWFNFDKINTYWTKTVRTPLSLFLVASNKQYPWLPLPAWLLEPAPSPTATLTATLTVAPTNVTSPTSTAIPPATLTLVLESTIVPVTAVIQPTFTATAVDTATSTQVPVPTPQPIPIVASTTRPTSTRAPTATPTPEQTATTLPTLAPTVTTTTIVPTQTLTATITTPAPSISVAQSAADCTNIPEVDKLQVSLKSPPNDSAGSGPQTFSWNGPVLSQQGDGIICAYELFFYQKGQDPLYGGFGWAGPTFNPAASFRLDDGLKQPPIPGTTYLWSVRLVVPGNNYQILKSLSAGQERTFRYELQGNTGSEPSKSEPCGGGSLNPCPTATP